MELFSNSEGKGCQIRRFSVVTGSTNPNLVVSNPCFLRRILFYAPSAPPSAAFLKIYDNDAVPTSSDVPIVTQRFGTSTTASIPGLNNRDFNIFCENGIGFRLTGAAADNDSTNITLLAGTYFIWVEYEVI